MEIISIVTEHLASAIDCILVIWVMTSFFGAKKKIRWWEYAIWFFVLFLPIGCMSKYFTLQCVVSIAVIFMFGLVELKGKRVEKLIAALIIFILIAFINVGTIQLISVVGQTPIDVLIVPGSLVRILVLSVAKVTLAAVLIFLELALNNKERYFKKEEYLFSAVLYLVYTIIATIASRIMGTVELKFEEQVGFFVLTMLLFVTNLFLLWLIKRMNYQNRCEIENTVLKLQLEQQEAQISNTELLYQNARKMRHDMKHYFTTYLQLLNEGEAELVKEEMQKALNTKFDVENIYFMESRQINAVINQKATVCKDMEIKFEVQITGEFKWRNESNIAILLSNLLDNAIEAEIREEEKKEMALKMFLYKEEINILVENCIAKSVLAENPLLKTTKKNKKYHGIGMESIREIVRQEEGVMDIAEEKGRFVIHIVIPCQ